MRLADFLIIGKLPEFTFCEAERGVADADHVMIRKHGLGNSLAVNKDAIVTAEIDDLIASRG